jgi:hypothetical protein
LSPLIEALGFIPKARERSLWIIANDREALESLTPLVDAVIARQERLQLIFTAPPSVAPWITQRFPGSRVHGFPAANPLSIASFLARGNFRTIAFVEDSAPPSAALLQGAIAAGVSLLGLSARAAGRDPSPLVSRHAEMFLTIANSGSARSPYRHVDVEDAVAILSELLGRDLKTRRQGRSATALLAGALLSTARNPRWRTSLSWRIDRLPDAQALNEALYRPGTIMCLGNGPSSEDARLLALNHDALFRVNHSWLARGFLTRPKVIFTGGSRSMTALGDAIFGLQSEEAERRILLSRMFNPALPATRFFNVHDVSNGIAAFPWGTLRPTNGATMIAAAVALKPKRLIVAGIDLFQHREGTYPGDTATPNAFSPAHDRDAERNFIISQLAKHEGELVIIGDILLEAYNRSKSGGLA